MSNVADFSILFVQYLIIQ